MFYVTCWICLSEIVENFLKHSDTQIIAFNKVSALLLLKKGNLLVFGLLAT